MGWRLLVAGDFMRIEYIVELDAEFLAVALLRRDVFGVLPVVAPLGFFTQGGFGAMADVALFNQIERNIDVLAGVTPPAGMPPTRIWRGGLLDVPFLDYTDVNRWFESLRLIRESLMGRGSDFRVTGTYAAGGNAIRQKIRLGR